MPMSSQPSPIHVGNGTLPVVTVFIAHAHLFGHYRRNDPTRPSLTRSWFPLRPWPAVLGESPVVAGDEQVEIAVRLKSTRFGTSAFPCDLTLRAIGIPDLDGVRLEPEAALIEQNRDASLMSVHDVEQAIPIQIAEREAIRLAFDVGETRRIHRSKKSVLIDASRCRLGWSRR